MNNTTQHDVPATIPKFPVDPITVEYLRSLKPHSPRDCTFDYVTKNAQFFMGPVNILLPCVLVGKKSYWRDAQSGGREQTTAYFFRMAGMTERLDHLGMVEKVYMNDSSEDALLETAYVRREPYMPTKTVSGWIAIDKASNSVTSFRSNDDPSRDFYASSPDDYHIVDVSFETLA